MWGNKYSKDGAKCYSQKQTLAKNLQTLDQHTWLVGSLVT